MTLGNKIRSRREELGLTQPELAQCSKLSQGYISRVENGEFMPKASTLIALSFALEIPCTELLEYSEETKR